MITVRAGAATDVGRVRANNQDRLVMAAPLFAVADGMGGHAAGEVASQTALDALIAAFTTGPDGVGPGSTAVALRDAVRVANRVVWDASEAHAELRGMGTTLTGAAVVHGDAGDELAVVNVGDSRTYRLHDGELEQLTADHSLVAELVAEGRIRSEEADTHPQRHVLTRALGVYPDVDVDLLTFEPHAGDRYLLCSDGLSREVTDGEVASVLRRLTDPEEAARELVAQARAHGGTDNITVVVVDILAVGTDGRATRGDQTPADDGQPTLLMPAVITSPGQDQEQTMAGTLSGPNRGRDHEEAAAEAGNDLAGGTNRPQPGATVVVPPPTRRARRQQRRTAKANRPDRRTRRRQQRAARVARGPKARVLTLRVVGFFVLALAIVGIAFAAAAWYARDSYFVQLRGRDIAIFKGRPGGVLWWHPTLADPTKLSVSDVEAHNLPALQAGVVEASLGAARQYVHNLQAEKAAATPTTTLPPATTVPASTTTVAPSTTIAHHKTTHKRTKPTKKSHRTTKKAAKR